MIPNTNSNNPTMICAKAMNLAYFKVFVMFCAIVTSSSTC